MAAKGMISFQPDRGWVRFQRALSQQRFSSMARAEIRKATKRNGLVAVRKIRQLIRGNEGGYEANAKLTRELKGSSVPLVGGKAAARSSGVSLFQAIRANTLDDYTVFAGVKFASEAYDLAQTLHEGATIVVTDAMRMMFLMLYWVSEGTVEPSELRGRAAELYKLKKDNWYPLSQSTTAIVIPPRPFIERAFEDDGLKREVKRNWEQAIQAAFRRVAKG